MSTLFTDADGREWDLAISVAALKRMRLLAKFALDDIMAADVDEKKPEDARLKFLAFLNDDVRFSEAIWSIVKPAADARNVTHEQFDEGLRGTANQTAIFAFTDAFTDFSLPPRKSVLWGIRLLLQKTGQAQEAVQRRMNQETGRMDDAAMDRLIGTEFDRLIKQDPAASKLFAGNTQAESPSTPVP